MTHGLRSTGEDKHLFEHVIFHREILYVCILCICIHICVYMCMCIYLHIEPVLIICGFCICEFPYSLKCICNLKISPCSAFMVSFRRVQSGKKFESCSQLRLNKATLCSLVSAPTIHKCPVPGLFSAPFSSFLYFLMVISLF